MAPREDLLNGCASTSRRNFLKRFATTAALPGVVLPRASAMQPAAVSYADARVDWKQCAGEIISLAGAIHPWSSAITPLLPQFTKLTGIRVICDFDLETPFLGVLPIRLARGASTPDVFMSLAYGQSMSAEWLEPLNNYYADTSLTDLSWYDEDDLLDSARAFSVWRDGERYAFSLTTEVITLFVNSAALDAKQLRIPQTFDELLAAATTLKTRERSGIAMGAQASSNSSPAAMSFVFSFGGSMIEGSEAAFASREAIAAIAMYGQMLRQAGPISVGAYDWYHVLNDFVRGNTSMAIDSSVLTMDISNPAKSPIARQAAFAVFPHLDGRAPVPFMSHWQACINARSRHKHAAFLFLLWATAKPTSLATAAAGLATTRRSAWLSPGFRQAFGAQAAAAAMINLQHADVERSKAIFFHPQSARVLAAFMIGVNEVVSGAKSADAAMTAAAKTANAVMRG